MVWYVQVQPVALKINKPLQISGVLSDIYHFQIAQPQIPKNFIDSPPQPYKNLATNPSPYDFLHRKTCTYTYNEHVVHAWEQFRVMACFTMARVFMLAKHYFPES